MPPRVGAGYLAGIQNSLAARGSQLTDHRSLVFLLIFLDGKGQRKGHGWDSTKGARRPNLHAGRAADAKRHVPTGHEDSSDGGV